MCKLFIATNGFNSILKQIVTLVTLFAFFFCTLPISIFAQSETPDCHLPRKVSSLKFTSSPKSFGNQSLLNILQPPTQMVSSDSIPDHTAYSLLFRLISHRSSDTKKNASTRNYLKERFRIGEQVCDDCPNLEQSNVELNNDVEAFMASTNEYKKRIADFDKLAVEVKFPNGKRDKSTAALEKLEQLQRQKVAFVDEVIAATFERLSQKGKLKLQQSVVKELKSKVKIQSRKTLFDVETNFSSSSNLFEKTRISPAKYKVDFLESASNDSSGYTDYSDVWMDSTDPENPVMVGFGATEVAYTSGEDVAEVTTELTSPSGTTISSSNFGEFFALAEVSFIWNWIPGNFFLSSYHTPYCFTCPFTGMRIDTRWLPGYLCPYTNDYLGPYGFGCGGSRFTSISIPVRIARDAYELVSETWIGGRFGNGVCDYDATCYGFCSLTSYGVDKVNRQNCPRYTQCKTVVFRGSCLNIAKVCVGSQTRGTCSS